MTVLGHAQLAHLGWRQYIAYTVGALHHLGSANGQVALLDRAAAYGGERVHDDEIWGSALGLDVRLDELLKGGRDEGRDDNACGGEHGAADKVRRIGEEGNVIVEFESEADQGLGGSMAAQGIALEDLLVEVGSGDEVVDLYFEKG